MQVCPVFMEQKSYGETAVNMACTKSHTFFGRHLLNLAFTKYSTAILHRANGQGDFDRKFVPGWHAFFSSDSDKADSMRGKKAGLTSCHFSYTGLL
jgi:hypothetical protein